MGPAPEQARLTRRARLQAILAGISAVLAVLAAVVPVWIEETTTLEPDAGSGLLEWLLSAVFGAASLALGGLSYRTRLRVRRVST
ncbi:ABC transporter permease [Streptomyces canus]|uniref:ABC transporter permease n=1 Tax=Streptomyces canus TaxID=58343 RepID=UPI002250D8D7|nr:ABC transporter permease [Streptomyces canus]MCX5262261.1 ABC transporter permease [Streptomyces canus]